MNDVLCEGTDSGAAKPTRVDAVALSLRNEILRGLKYPRERLAEVSLAEELKVSRGTVGEALQRLAIMGFIVGEPHKGFVVRKFTYEDVIGLGECSRCLTRKPLKASNSQSALRLWTSCAKALMRELDLPRDWDAFWELDRAFHGLYMAESKHPWLLDTWQRLQPFLTVITVPLLQNGRAYPGQLATARHLELLEAIASEDVSTARQAIEQHYHQHEEPGTIPVESGDRPEDDAERQLSVDFNPGAESCA